MAVALVAGVATAAVAMGGRWLLQPWLDGNLVFVFAFPAVVAMALWAGLVPALATAVLCAVASILQFTTTSLAAVLQSTLFLATSAVLAVLAAYVSDNLRQHQAQPTAQGGPDPGRGDAITLLWLRIGVVLSVLVPWAVFAGVALSTHGTATENAKRRLDRIAGIAHEHALKLFETTDLLVRQVNQQTGQMTPAELRREEVRLSGSLAELTRGLGHIHSVWILDAEGNGLVSSRTAPLPASLRFPNGPAYLAHKARPGQLVLVPPRMGKFTHEVFFHLSRRRDTADGQFNGYTMVGLQPSYFTSFYRELADSEPGVVITLVHADGRLMARWPAAAVQPKPFPPDAPFLKEQRGFRTGVSPIDGVTRMGAYRRIGAYPAVALAGMDEATALAGWRREMLALAAFILPLSIGLALICHQALRRTRQHIAAAQALRAEASERQRVEAALRQSQKLEAMGHLTGGVAHDFNNLLMVVNLNVTLLRQRLREQGHDRQLAAIERSVAAGKKLTRQLLAFSRRQPLLPRVLDLAELMPSLLDLIRPALGSRIELEHHVAPGTPRVRLDSGELELALINLAVNARDAMPNGGRIRIRVAGDGDFVELAFSDTGVGIAPADLERVFEPFFTTKPVGVGTGLGLAQVYGLCARAGGTARVESEPGAGTTVFLRFPAVEAPADEGPTLPPSGWSIEKLQLRVLLVEDNADIASATREVLQAAGCEVLHVPSPAEALQVLEDDDEFDVVLSDIVMPGGMDGLQLSARLRRDHPRLPVVLMTGYAQKLGEAEAQGLVVLPKPFDPALLLRTLREQVRVTDDDFARA
jgi:two-component system NtrC family sensor kinase